MTAHSNRWKTRSDFAIGLISSPHWEQDTERKRRPSNDRVDGNKIEKKTVLSTPRGTRLRSAALQTIESAAESEIGPVHEDYKKWLETLAPLDASPQRYRHNRTGEDNADAHMKRQIIGRQVVVAITKGKVEIGPWE